MKNAELPARHDHAMCYDAGRAVTVVFGGYTNAGRSGQTWEWDGAAWALRADAGPSARYGHAMAFDSMRAVTVLFGGYTNQREYGETWEWDGVAWMQRDVEGPSPRRGHAMAFDSSRGVTVLFGGNTDDGFNAETWEWDGETWTQKVVDGPGPRAGHALVYDPARGVTVLFGGFNPPDTWEWDGVTWTLVATDGPPFFGDHGMAMDTARGVIVLFGGYNPGTYFRETWEWDGLAWLLRAEDGPSARASHAMAFDESRNVTVLFGGSHYPDMFSDTWEWDGAFWSRRLLHGPQPRSEHALVYDANHEAVLLFGGAGKPYVKFADTWEYPAGDNDCNTNGVGDACEAFAGTSPDCNTNAVPDECEDCNTNGHADVCDIAAGTATDCNTNAVPDDCDLVVGTSADCNLDLVSDDCEPDCNTNLILDSCDTTQGSSFDCNGNTVPDECEDCNTNLFADGCDIALGSSDDCNTNGLPDECENTSWSWDNGPADGNGLVNQIGGLAPGEVADDFVAPAGSVAIQLITLRSYERFDFYWDGGVLVSIWADAGGFPSESPYGQEWVSGEDVTREEDDTCCIEWVRRWDYTIQTNLQLPGPGRAWFSATPSSNASSGQAFWATSAVPSHFGQSYFRSPFFGFDSWTPTADIVGQDYDFTFTLSLDGSDCNESGVVDACEIAAGSAPDCDTNGLPDECDIGSGTSRENDCNTNGRPDACDTAAGTSWGDCNTNGLLDECDAASGTDADCNTNSIADLCDSWQDCNANNIHDVCDLASGDCDTNAIPDDCATDCNINGIPDACEIAGGTAEDCNTNGWPDACDVAWLEDSELTASTVAAEAEFGRVVAIDGEWCAVGAPFDDPPGLAWGSAFMYRNTEGAWTQVTRLFPSDGQPTERFAEALAMYGDVLLVGVPSGETSQGHTGSAYVFRWNGVSWIEEQKLVPSDGKPGDGFGAAVALNGTRALLTAPGDDPKASVHYFEWDGTEWIWKQKFTASDVVAGDSFGLDIAMTDTLAIVGASGSTVGGQLYVGAAYLFERNGAQWAELQKLTSSDGAYGDRFGSCVSIEDHAVLVGAPYESEPGEYGAGAIYAFITNGLLWTEHQKFRGADTRPYDVFGFSISVFQDLAVVGAPYGGPINDEPGAAYLFRQHGQTWSQQNKLTATDGAHWDGLGWAVAIRGPNTVVGAPFADGQSRAESDTGSACIFAAPESDSNNNGIPDECDEFVCLTCPGDVSADGFVDADDLPPFVACLLADEANDCPCADLNADGLLDESDVAPLVDKLLMDAETNCP